MENKVHFFRMTHFAKEGITHLLLGLTFLFVLNSCSKEAALEEVSPASVETTSILKEWATKNDHLNQANLIEWNYSTPITLSDSIKGYAAPVKTESGFKEFITFELGGKRHGWFKTYKRLNETDMEIVIQSIEGQTLKSGVLHKSKNMLPKGKISSMREMNFEEGPITFDTIFDNFIFSAPRSYPPGEYVYVGTYQYEFKAYYDSESYIGGSGGAGSSSLYFEDFNTTKIVDKLTDPCFKTVLNDLINKNVINEVGDIIRKFVNNPMSKVTFKQKYEVTKKDGTPLFGSFDPNTNEITLSESKLKNASKEFIAIAIIHELFHAEIRNTEKFDHTKMLNDFVIPAGEYMGKLYNLNSRTAQNLFIAGLVGADGYLSTVYQGYDMYFYDNRKKEIDQDMYNYAQEKISGNHCN
ncbi:MAG: hypothetical protein RL422_148 [Bacteroidota bacterium]